MKKQLTGVMAIVIVGAFLTSGSFAYFSATSKSEGNVFSSSPYGVDFYLSPDGSSWQHDYSPLMTVSNLLPGQETGMYYIHYLNSANSVPVKVTATTSYNYWWAGQTVTADNFAKHLWITQGSLDTTTGVQYYWALQIADQFYSSLWANALTANAVAFYNGNYVPTFYGMQQITLHFWDTYNGNDIPWPTGQQHYTGLKFMLDPTVGNEYVNAGIIATFTAAATQV